MIIDRSAKVARALMAASLACFFALAGGLYVMEARQDANALENQTTMVEGGFAQLKKSAADFVIDWGWWDDMYLAATNKDAEWFGPNVSTTLMDIVFILDHNYEPTFALHKDLGPEPNSSYLTEDFLKQIRTLVADKPEGMFEPRTSVITAPDAHYVVAITHIYPGTESLLVDKDKLLYLVLGYKLEQGRMDAIGKTYLLDGFKYQTSPEGGMVEVKGVEGKPVGSLHWNFVAPSAGMLMNFLIAVFISAITIVCLGVFFVKRSERATARLAQQEAESREAAAQAMRALAVQNRMEQLGKLTATVAHEIRNPLGAVRTSAFLLERKLAGKNAGVEAQIERINNGIVRCDNIITQLLDFSRAQRLDCKPANLDEWLATVVSEQAKRLPDQVAVRVELGMDGQLVPFDAGRLERAVINAMSNASEAMVGNGKGVGGAGTVDPMIVVRTRLTENYALIELADNGPGMSAAVLTKIRDPLFTTKSFGTGLGVPAIERIVEQHGGKLDIKSIEGKGATFIIHLPLVNETVTLDKAA